MKISTCLIILLALGNIGNAQQVSERHLDGSHSSVARSQEAGQGQSFAASGKAEIARSGLFADGKVLWAQVRNTATILFEDVRAELGNTTGQDEEPLSATWIGSIRIPAEKLNAARGVNFTQHLRLSVTKNEKARVVLYMNAGGEFPLSGQTYTIEFPYGKDVQGDVMRNLRYSAKANHLKHYTATFILTVERLERGNTVSVSIDSLDIINNLTGKPAKRR